MKKHILSLGSLSSALIMFQIVLMQVFSIVQWYHFAFMVISVALLGFGASGTLLALFRRWLVEQSDLVMPLAMFLSGASMSIAVGFSQLPLIRFDSYLAFVDISQTRGLLLTYLALTAPFFFGALPIGIAFIVHSAGIGRIYAANLIGSGLGGVLAIAVLGVMAPQQAPAFVGLIPIIAGVLILPKRNMVLMLAAALLAAFVSSVAVFHPPTLVASQYKNLSRTMNLPDAKVVLEDYSPYGLIQVVSSSVLRYAPGLSVNYHNTIPIHEMVFCNGDWVGPLIRWNRNDSLHLLDYSTLALPYVISTPQRVLVLHARTGNSIAHALVHGAGYISAVEPYRPLVSLLRESLASTTDSLLYNPHVSVHAIDPRTFLLSDTSSYDLIALPLLDSFGGTAGLYAVQEQYSLTKEAFLQMWNRLRPDGIISVSSWMDYPFRNPLKLLATLVEVLESAGIKDPARNIAAVRSWGTITFVAKRSPLSSGQVEQVRLFCRTMSFDPAILVDLQPGERVQHNLMDDERFFGYLDDILSSRREHLYSNYDFNIRPCTDNRPYFFQYLQWQSLPYLTQVFGARTVPFLEIGYLIVAITLVQILVVAFVLMVLPLFRLGLIRGHRMQTILYFGGLGIGFMFIEIVFIQRFTLYFGQPIYAAAAVISCLLLCSGTGSYLSSRLDFTPKNIGRILILIVVLILIYTAILTPLLRATISLSTGMKALLTLLLIAPLGLFMGIPFPLGLRHASRNGEPYVPWAWGINGCASVLSTPLATIIAVEAGFTLVMILAATAYGLAATFSYSKSLVRRIDNTYHF